MIELCIQFLMDSSFCLFHDLITNGDIFQAGASNQLTVRQTLDPVTEGVPFIQLMVPPALVNIGQHFIVEHDRSPLVVGGREKLDHLPPVFLVFGFEVFFTVMVKDIGQVE